MAKSRKKIIIVVVVIAAVAVAGLIGFFQVRNLAQQGSTTVPQTVVLKKTTLEDKVTASGNFASVDPVSVGSNVTGGEVETVYVKEGDSVYAGDVLAQLKTEDIERNIADTKSAINDAVKGDNQNIAAAQRALDNANADNYATDCQTYDALIKAQKAYDTASSNWNSDKKVLQNALSQAQTALDAAQKALDEATAAAEDQTTIDGLTADRDAALAARDAARAARDAAKAPADQAKAALDAAKQQRDNSMRAVNSQVTEAQAKVDSLSGVDSAKQSRSQLDSLNEDLSNASIVSPITGIVTAVNTEAGKAAMADMFTVEDTVSLQITASVAEYDVVKVKEGMAAHITSNATSAQTYDGVVDYVSPTASDTSGNFEIKVKLTSDPGELKPGMTATIEVVTQSKQDIFAVPIDAVVTLPDGRKAVYAYEPVGGARTGGGPTGGGQATAGNSPAAGGDQAVAGNGPATTGGQATAGNGGQVTAGNGGSAAGSDQATAGNGQVSGNGAATAGNGPTTTGNGGQAATGGGSTTSGGPTPGSGTVSLGSDRREIIVQTGMETDYYIEIISDELSEGMLILSDPQNLNVPTTTGGSLGMLGGGARIGGGGGGGGQGGGGGTSTRSTQSGTVVVAN